jgi:UDP-4-amino-4,6-dideoxy-N-acetyl-beta-L-altrosamine transaminase
MTAPTSGEIIPYGRQDINQADIDAVTAVLCADFLTQGPVVPAFEEAVARYCGVRCAVATNSATSALHVACLALGVGPGDIVWTTPITFVASANCALYCGATVDFVDIDPHTYNMCPERLAAKLAQAESLGKLPKVVIPVHMCGQSCDMAPIHALAQRYGFKVIEDASHAIGGKYRGEPVGCCRYSDITVFSFHPVKIVTAGEGGMALTNDDRLARNMEMARSHGITSTPSEMVVRPAGEMWNYQQVGLGFNYRMTDILAALGLSQMQRLDEFVVARHAIADRYGEWLDGLPVVRPHQHPDTWSSYHLYVVRMRLTDIARSQREVYERLHAVGIRVNLHYIPVYRQPYYEAFGFRPGYCPAAEQYYREAVSIPMYPRLTQEQQKRVVVSMKEAMSA